MSQLATTGFFLWQGFLLPMCYGVDKVSYLEYIIHIYYVETWFGFRFSMIQYFFMTHFTLLGPSPLSTPPGAYNAPFCDIVGIPRKPPVY